MARPIHPGRGEHAGLVRDRLAGIGNDLVDRRLRGLRVERDLTRPDTVASAGQAVAESAPDIAPAAAAEAQGTAVAASAAATVAGVVAPTGVASVAISARAALAWIGGANTDLEEQSVAAIQSFMPASRAAESASYAGSVRDAIGDALSRFPCSRLQAAYQPETGGLEVRGHVPDTALRTDVVAMLERSVGGSIPIGGSLLVLPQPQCDVLNAVEELGFPQSVDQANDPLVVGEQAQAEILEFEDGRSVDFGMQAPEFDADIYVDYYDGDGNVLHLLPNEYTQDNRLPANSHFTIGDRETSGTRYQVHAAGRPAVRSGHPGHRRCDAAAVRRPAAAGGGGRRLSGVAARPHRDVPARRPRLPGRMGLSVREDRPDRGVHRAMTSRRSDRRGCRRAPAGSMRSAG